ncbi:hypothetical protein MNB_SV-13-736 [hydrothermal vent metagenome]|uniref:Uncharacterized protein n=1 Tax=hydrothermal vent metagenome TaxID=652676 RepID=A0A1W1CUW2_9ZZZZ
MIWFKYSKNSIFKDDKALMENYKTLTKHIKTMSDIYFIGILTQK